MDQDQQTLYGPAVNEARTALNAEETRWNELQGNLRDRYAAGASSDNPDVKLLQGQAETQSNRVAASEREYANLLERVAQDSRQRVRSEPSPKQQAVWDGQAANAQALADLHRAQADVYDAKTADASAAAKTRAQAALQNANTAATRSSSQIDQAGASADLSRARAAQIETLTPTLVRQHQAQIDLIGQRQGLVASQANLADARAAFISGPQATAEVSRGNMSQATADFINKSGGAKIQDLIDKGLLDEAHAAQVYANINKQQQAPYADTKAPNLLTFDPRTGTYSSQPNAAYVPDSKQALADEAATIAQLQKQLADGSIQPGEASQILANIRQSTAARTAGFTPEQYQQVQQNQAAFGKSTIDDMLGRGDSEADRLLSAAKGVRGIGGLSFTPHMNAFNAMGGAPAYQKAMELMSQVQPVTDRMSSLDAISKYAGAKALLSTVQQSGGGGGQTPAAAPQAQPDQTPPPTGPAQLPAPGQDQGNPSDAGRLLQAAMAGAGGGGMRAI